MATYLEVIGFLVSLAFVGHEHFVSRQIYMPRNCDALGKRKTAD